MNSKIAEVAEIEPLEIAFQTAIPNAFGKISENFRSLLGRIPVPFAGTAKDIHLVRKFHEILRTTKSAEAATHA